jgi:S1-C subfamily serine protease
MSHPFEPSKPEQTGETQSERGAVSGHGQGYPHGHPGSQGYPAGSGSAGGSGYPGGSGYAGGSGYGAGSWYAGGAGYGEPPMPPRRSRKRALIATGAVALAAGAALGGLIGSMDHTATGTVTSASKTALSSSEIASRVDPALVDVISTDGYQGATSEGTGIVLTSTGEVLTNNHVIEGATSIKAIDIGNGKTYTATVVGYDASHDVAVIQLQNASGLTTANLGDSSTVQTGNSVTALGNAEGKGGTPSVATGTVTALNQSITASDELSNVSEQLTGLIETNAPIQPGDSGGPLVNAYGQVVGMDTAASSSYQLQGQSSTATQAFSIPIDEAVSVAKQIEASTTTSDIHIGATAFLGVELQSSSSSSSNVFGGFGGSSGFGGQNSQGDTNGVTIAGTVSGSPAATAGLTEGDTITAIGGQSVTSAEDVAHALVKYHPGNTISVTWVDQDGQSHTSNLTLASGPAA